MREPDEDRRRPPQADAEEACRNRLLGANDQEGGHAEAKEAVPVLLEALNDQDRMVRVSSIQALEKIDPKDHKVETALKVVAEKDKDAYVAAEAKRVLRESFGK